MRPNRMTVGVGAVAIALSLTACSAERSQPTDSGAETQPGPSAAAPTPPPVSSATPEPAAEQLEYRDGVYSARGWYGGLPSHHDVTLTVEGDVVTAVEITTPAENETSLGYQQRFAEALPQAIVGRSIDELDVDRLAGSSGCSEGFMDALAQIKADAAA